MAQILLTTHGTEGDIIPFLRIGKALRQRGHEVILFTHCRFEALSHEAGLTFLPLDRPEEYAEFVAAVPLLHALPTVPEFFHRQVLPKLAWEYEQIYERSDPGKTILVSRATPGIAARMAAEALHLPHLSVFLAPSHVTTFPLIEDAIGKFLGQEINHCRNQVGLPPVEDWVNWWHSPQASLGLWPDWFWTPEGEENVPEVSLVGFLALTGPGPGALPHNVEAFLSRGTAPVLITHSTSVAEGPEFYRLSIEACRRLQRRCLVVTPHLQPELDQPSDQVLWVDRVPFPELMPRVAAIIHHGGLGTLSQALAAGIPQLALTDSSERTDNGSHMQLLGAGEAFSRAHWKTDRLVEALSRLLNSPAVREQCEAIAQRIAATDPATAACEVIEATHAKGGWHRQAMVPLSAKHNASSDLSHLNHDLRTQVENLSTDRRALLLSLLKRPAPTQPHRPPTPSESRGEAPETFPLSFAQERLWFMDQLDPATASFNEPYSLRLTGALNELALERSFAALHQRHGVLRATYQLRDSGLVQIITPPPSFHLPLIDLHALPAAAREEEAQRLARSEALRPYDLTQGPVLRLRLVRLEATDHLLIIILHHIAADHGSIAIFLRELVTLYPALAANQQPSISPETLLPALPLQYTDFARWQRTWLQDQNLERLLSYWSEQLRGAPPRLELPTDYPRPRQTTAQGERQTLMLPGELAQALKALGRHEQATLFMVLIAAFNVLLYRYSGQSDLVIGTPVTGRNRPDLAGVIGPFLNMLPLRFRLDSKLRFPELLAQVREVAQGAYAHQDLPFEKLVEALQPERSLQSAPVFQVVFSLQNIPMPPLELPGLVTRELQSLNIGIAKFDLHLYMEEIGSDFIAVIEYNTHLFEHQTIARWLGHWRTLLEGIVAHPEQRLFELPWLTEAESRRLQEWNATQTSFPSDASLLPLIEAQVERTPDAIAVTFAEENITYTELNRRAGQLAHYLQELGVGPESLVGICLDRSVELMVGLLGILKAGAAYVPLDPSYPAERLAYMLEDSQATVLLTQSRWLVAGRWSLVNGDQQPATSNQPPTTICLDTDWTTITNNQQPATNNRPPVSPDNLLYLIYTSGSTGQPKGAMNSHRGLCNRLHWMQATYHLTEADRVLQKTPYSFDVSVWEFFWPLMTGACLIMARPGGHQDSAYLARLIVEAHITTLHFVPSMLHIFLEEGEVAQYRSLKRVICSGEALSAELVERFYQPRAGDNLLTPDRPSPTPELHNLYGPTEAAIDVTSWACAPDSDRRAVPIGRPIANTQIYILDAHLQPVPVGVRGELYIGGVGVGRGYWGRPELTAERFIPNPFLEKDEVGRMKDEKENEDSFRLPPSSFILYKTGDLARYHEKGDIEYLGRSDQQVKLRGQRIELGEIEARLALHPGVRDVVVIAREAGAEKRLVAYLVPVKNAIAIGELRNFLQARLPDSMIPATFVWLEKLPLTANGKIDRRALPTPAEDRPPSGEAFLAPRTPVEEILAGVWSRLLGVQPVGVHDNFFELGGHSLLATRLASHVRSIFQVDLPLRAVFEAPTVAALAQRVALASRASLPPISPAARDDQRLSFAQQRLWFLNQLAPDSPFYHMPAAIRLNGSLKITALQQSLQAIVQRHEALRTTFTPVDGEPVQVIATTLDLELPLVDLAGLPEEAQERELRHWATQVAQQPFDLSHGPLLRTHLLRLAVEAHVLLLNMHHIVFDGWSLGIVSRELSTLYSTFVTAGAKSPLPELPIRYTDYAAWQRDWLQSTALENQLAYWRERLADLPVLELPTDYPRPTGPSFHGAAQPFALSPFHLAGLKNLGREVGATLFMVLLTAFQVLLYRYTGQRDIVVGTRTAGRTHPELDGLVGYFVNALVLRTDLSDFPSFRELLKRVREVCLEAYARQDLPFEKLVEELQPRRDLSRQPLFQVMFVLQNAPLADLKLAGLNVSRLTLESTSAKLDLDFSLEENEEGLVGQLEYRKVSMGMRQLCDKFSVDPACLPWC